jgi:hypothetical protein
MILELIYPIRAVDLNNRNGLSRISKHLEGIIFNLNINRLDY